MVLGHRQFWKTISVRVLFYLSILAIVYGSLFPFKIIVGWPSMDAIRTFVVEWSVLPGRGDVLGNIVLFFPYGLFGTTAILRTQAPRIARLFGSGLLLALLLQVAQLWVRSRTPQIQDVMWNGLGAALGIAFALLPSVRDRLVGAKSSRWASPGSVLVVLWMFAIALPLVPSIDFASFKESLKPLLLRPRFSGVEAFSAFAAWVGVGCLLGGLARPSRQLAVLALLVVASFALKILMVRSAITVSYALGAIAALPATAALLRLRFERTRYLSAAALLLFAILWAGFTPLVLREDVAGLSWVPFIGALVGDLLTNVRATAEKLFLYGASIWLLMSGGWRLRRAAVAVGVVTLVVELAQIFLMSGVPEVTDPLLVLGIALIFGNRRRLFSDRSQSRPA